MALEEEGSQVGGSNALLRAEVVDLQEVRASIWRGGAPEDAETRALVWKLLLEYLPAERAVRDVASAEMRRRYGRIVAAVTTHPTDSAPEDDHPLSDNKDSHWAKFFSVQESERLITLDVRRTHPDLGAFRKLEASMRRVLIAYASQHPNPGYRQGINELLAPLIYVFSDASSESPEDAEADAYHCLCTIMSEMSPLYLSSPEPLNREFVRLNEILQLRDPKLYEHLSAVGVEPRLYALRWLRLWLTQEFALPDTLLLWDSILTSCPRLPWLRYICAAMVIAVRDRLLSADFNVAAQVLLRYATNNVRVQRVLALADGLRTGLAPSVRGADD